MKVHTLAGSRSSALPNADSANVVPPTPLYRWKVKVADSSYRHRWIHDPDEKNYGLESLGERTVVVTAPTEAIAHAKASAVFDPLPADHQDDGTYSDWTRYERVTTTIGEIEEVVR